MKRSQPDIKKTYTKHTILFEKFSNNGLVAFYNIELEKSAAAQISEGIWIALIGELRKREIDFSTISNSEELPKSFPAVILVGKKLYTIDQVPLEIAEGLVMMYLKARETDFEGLQLNTRNKKEISYTRNGMKGTVSANAVIRSFTEGLLKPAG